MRLLSYLAFLVTYMLCAEFCSAQPAASPKRVKRRLTPHNTIEALDPKGSLPTLEFGINEVVSSYERDVLDRTISNSYLNKLYEESLPSELDRDFDYEKNRHLANRVLAIKSAESLSSLMKRSDLAPLYRSIKQGLGKVRDQLRFSLQDDGDDWIVSSNKRGKKLFEFGLELDARTGFEPQMRVGENIRFRYDYLERRSLVEYGISF
ncbi:MAG: hypothetical protein DCC75_09190 [Proteobacteria bacterium]|nr:MAG: hypothetical protein DCC75_09190 [Pseudomonadota bacterium]